MTPKVSIIIPCYNALPFIQETIERVTMQSYANYELIVVDDGSTDGSLDYLKGVVHPSLTVLSNKGKGACAARNYGFKSATGTYIQFLDADDFFDVNKIEEQVKLLESKPDTIAVCSTVHFTGDPAQGRITDREVLKDVGNPSDFLLRLYGANGTPYMVQTSAWLTPRQLIEKAGGWNETLSKDQDGEFFCRVLMQSKGVLYAPHVLNYYRKHPLGTNIANQKLKTHVLSQLQALNSKQQQLEAVSETQAFKKAFALQYKWLGIEAYPDFKDISEQALQVSKTLGGSTYMPVLGGKFIEIDKIYLGLEICQINSIIFAYPKSTS